MFGNVIKFCYLICKDTVTKSMLTGHIYITALVSVSRGKHFYTFHQ